ncbi:MAG: prepilin-type N-terminal cleavage/methylation domain-containing protein [bacterium]
MKKGFSYLEVLVVVVLFAIGIVALGTARMRSVQAETSVRLEKNAINDLEDFIENIMSTDYDSINSGDTTIGATTIEWVVNDDTSGIRGKVVTIEYYWHDLNNNLRYDTINFYVAERGEI